MEKYTELLIKSSIDGSFEPSLFFAAKGEEKRPLLVGLHTWSNNRFNQINNLLPLAEKHNFNLLLPEFRGPNTVNNPRGQEACCSDLAITDVYDAINYACANHKVDSENVFVIGLSGGGQMALMFGAKYPQVAKSIAAFCPVCDLDDWMNYYQGDRGYCPDVKHCCQTKDEIIKRSPSSYAKELSKTNLKIFHGKFDNVVPVKQSISLFYEILNIDPASTVYLDVFDGKHELDIEAAEHWILSQYKPLTKTQITG